VVGTVAALVAGCARATRPDEARSAAAMVGEALRLAGTREGLRSLAEAMRSVVSGLAGADRFGDADLVARVLEREITAHRLYEAHAAHAATRFDRARFERLLALLREPLTRLMTAMEIAAAGAGAETVAAWAATVQGTDAGRERLALGRRLDDAIGGTDATLEVLLATGRGAVRAFGAAVPPGSGDPLGEFRETVRKLEPEIREQTAASLAFTYRDATVAEIVRYAESLESELGRWFSRLQRDSAVYAAEVVTEAAIRRVLAARRAPRI
jgi:hypothetical protein